MDKKCGPGTSGTKCQSHIKYLELEEKVKSLENSLQQLTISLKNKENLVKIQTTQLQKMETMHKSLVDENENLSSKNRKQTNDIENLKIILKGFEQSTNNTCDNAEVCNAKTQTPECCQAMTTNTNQASNLTHEEIKLAKVILLSFNAAIKSLCENTRGKNFQIEESCSNLQCKSKNVQHAPEECTGFMIQTKAACSDNFEKIALLEEENKELRSAIENLKPPINTVETKSIGVNTGGCIELECSGMFQCTNNAESKSLGTNTERTVTPLDNDADITSDQSQKPSNTVETNALNVSCKCFENEALIKEVQNLKKEILIMQDRVGPRLSPKVEEEMKELENYKYEMLSNFTNVILNIYKEKDELQNLYELFETKFNESLKMLDATTSLLQNKTIDLRKSVEIVNSEGKENNYCLQHQLISDNQRIIDEYLYFKQFLAVQIQEIIFNTCISSIKISSYKLIEVEGIAKVFNQMLRELKTTLQNSKSSNHNLMLESEPSNTTVDNYNQTLSELKLCIADLISNMNSFNKTLHKKNIELQQKYKNVSELSQSKSQENQLLQSQIQEKEEEICNLSSKLENVNLLLKNNVEIFKSTLANLKEQSEKFKAAFKNFGSTLLNLKAESQEHTEEINNLKQTFKIVHFLKQKNCELLERNTNQNDFLIQQKNVWGQILEDNKWLQCQCEQISWDNEMINKSQSEHSECKSLMDENEFLKQNFTYCHDCMSLNQIMGNNLEWQEKVKKLTEFICRREMEIKVCFDQKLRASELLESVATRNAAECKLAVIKEISNKTWNQEVEIMNCLLDGDKEYQRNIQFISKRNLNNS